MAGFLNIFLSIYLEKFILHSFQSFTKCLILLFNGLVMVAKMKGRLLANV